MKPEARLLRSADGAAQAEQLAAAIAVDLAAALTRREAASLVVSGGRTPQAMFAQLANHAIDWARVQVTLADERWVDTTDPASNEGLVRSALLRDRAACAQFVPLKTDAATPAEGANAAWRAVNAMPQPFDVVVLGMGDDGHTASLFPGSAGLSQALDKRAAPACVAIEPLAAAHARLSLNLAALLRARRICIQVSGAGKWAVYQQAIADGPDEEMPVRAVLRQSVVPVDVYWCSDQPTVAPA
ncbi:MAG: 6-phosphogluconolactonase [Steroidobacteraceae bacterium]